MIGALIVGLWASTALAADGTPTLVQKDGAAYRPGLAKSWQQQGSAVVFVLNDGTDGAKAAQIITGHLNGAQAVFAGGVLKVSGLPLATLLEQLANLNVTSDDPLGELGALQGAAVASNAGNEGGGSIRAARPTDFAAMAGDANHAVDMHEVLEAEVLEVKRGAFPNVVLRLRVRKAAEAGPLVKQLHKGRVIEGTVLFVGKPIDLRSQDDQRNLAAFYLAAGDKVALHAQAGAAGQFDRVGVDWLERH